jgi:hypothetical protein
MDNSLTPRGSPQVLFRKKPVVVEAMQFAGGWRASGQAILEWTKGNGIVWRSNGTGDAGGVLASRTLEGEMIANPGDWIIRGVKGELYPCKPDIFDATYEPAEMAREPASRGEASTPPSAHEEAARVAVIEECAKVADHEGLLEKTARAQGVAVLSGVAVANIIAVRIRALATPKDAGGEGDDSSLPKTAGPQV